MSYGLHNLDEKILKILNFENGFFVEAGANDGISQSNTALYEFEYGWKGLLVEPNFKKYLECKAHRKNSIVENCALVSHNYDKKTITGNFNHTGYTESLTAMVYDSGDWCDEILKEHKDLIANDLTEVPAKTIDELLEKHKINHIDLFSLDVEGYEISALNGLTFEKVSPTYFLIETASWDHRRKVIIDYMISKGYSIEMDDELGVNDILFKKNDI
jgi:FkbM family methyltransferase